MQKYNYFLMSQMLNYLFLNYLKKQKYLQLFSCFYTFFNPFYTENAPFIKEESSNNFPVFIGDTGLKQGNSFFLIHYFPKSSNMP